MESNAASPTETAKGLWHTVRAVFGMFSEGLSKRRIFSDLRLHCLFHQGKLAGRSLRSLFSDLSNHYHSSIHSNAVETFSCRFVDPDAVIIPRREVEFRCSNTPFYATARRKTHHLSYRRRRHRFNGYHAAAISRAFEILDSVPDNRDAVDEMLTPMMSVLATPAASVRTLRVTDSPFPVKENEDIDEAVDWEAEEFIRQFYEQLRLQQMRSY